MIRRYLLDALNSRFTVQAFASGILSGFAHNPKFAIREFSGDVRFDPADGGSYFVLSVKTASLQLLDDVKEQDRLEIQRAMTDEVLEATKYPEIAFSSSGFAITRIADNWYRAQMKGEMQLHGITRPTSVDAQLRLAEGDLRLNGETILMLSDFKMKQVTALGGLIKVKNELKFIFDLLAHEQNRQNQE